MNVYTIILFFVSVLLFSGCASKHPGNMGEVIGKKIILMDVSGDSNDQKKESPFQLVEITIENKSNDWIRISRAEVLIGDPAVSKVSVVMGPDLVSWVEANQYETSLKQHNQALVQAGIAAAGTGVAVSGTHKNNRSMVGAGLTAFGTAGAMATSGAIKDAIKSVETANKVPNQHLYQPFSVPGKMFLRRWVLLNKPVGVLIDKLAIEFETAEGKKETYVIQM
ncbi:MAG: hypothetical protein JNL11_05725 [Bdellovibrionaceae bacterium]|nr:hypothetical protein [Pseudobdellovibrionaceae bacterium]